MSRVTHGMKQEEIDAYRVRYGGGPHFAADLTVVSVPWNSPVPSLQLLLVRRAYAPFPGTLALPGGFVEPGEDLEQAARRELVEETGLRDLETAWVEQLQTYGCPDRDPRARVITVVFLALVACDRLHALAAGDDASEARFFELRGPHAVDEAGNVLDMAFDHELALRDLRARLQRLASHSSAPLALLPPEFTLEQARTAYELLLDRPVDAQPFESRMSQLGWLRPVETPDAARGGGMRFERAKIWTPGGTPSAWDARD